MSWERCMLVAIWLMAFAGCAVGNGPMILSLLSIGVCVFAFMLESAAQDQIKEDQKKDANRPKTI